jgi:hypothetical protein
MRIVQPHEFFRLDFDAMLEEGKRQERIHPANEGEADLIQAMHAYLHQEVFPLIADDDCVYEAASRFATEYALVCFRSLQLTNKEIYDSQKQLHDLNERVIDFLARARLEGAAPLAGEVDLPKASDFTDLVDLDGLPSGMQKEAMELLEEAKDHEILQLTVTLRGIRDEYTTNLPRIMFVVRRAMKVRLGQHPTSGDEELRDISNYLNWYDNNVTEGHPLYPVLGELRSFYKIARNVESHPQALEWRPDTNTVVLADANNTVPMHVHEFQQRFRYLTYLCELGLRGILSAFCERERGSVANSLVKEYVKTFPDDFPEGEPGTVSFYPV